MDVETKAAFATVDSRFDQVEALLVKLAEGQVRNDTAIAKLTEQVSRSAVLINALAEGQVKLTDRVDKLAERIDGFASLVVRGFTEGAGRDIASDKRVDQLEARVAKLEQRT